MQFPMPKHIADQDAVLDPGIRARFLLRLAALYYSPEGKLNTLSRDLGLNSSSLAGLDNISADLAVKLENILDRELFPRELFRPDLFQVAQV